MWRECLSVCLTEDPKKEKGKNPKPYILIFVFVLLSAPLSTSKFVASAITGQTNSKMTSENDATVDEPLDIDDKCDVRWREGNQSLRAKVVERRPLNFRKRKTKYTSPPPMDTLKPDEIEYYIHYENQDR